MNTIISRVMLIAVLFCYACGSPRKMKGKANVRYETMSETISTAYASMEEMDNHYLGSSLEDSAKVSVPDYSYPYRNGSGLADDMQLGSYVIDISHHNGIINWPLLLQDSVPKRIGCVIMKATDGERSDPTFASNYKTVSGLGIKCGAYHYYVQKGNPVMQ
ncbi:MAG TPA: GH25 family lysozyme, partial [Chryseolinea sp.]|nr:GH25 family lysozyme [Chryseolinea sp.]